MKEKTDKKLFNNIDFLKIFVFFSPLLFGGFHVWTAAAFTGLLCLYICTVSVEQYKNNKLKIGISLLSLLLLPVSYLTVSLWAVDSGTAVYGFVKLLPVALFGLIVSGYDEKKKRELIEVVPYSAVAMGVLSYALSFIPQLSVYFLVAERLGGFFQYPNSFALYCLAGMIILLTKQSLKLPQWLAVALLVGIIFLSGSRTVFVFLVASVLILLFKLKAKNKVGLLVIFGVALLTSIIVVVLTDNIQTVGRFLTISLESSTLLGRLLYYKDALPVILKNPFGLGYYGYYFSQTSFQTGVYSVVFAHNDILQLLLDIGWLPSLLFFFALGASFFSKKTEFYQKLLMLVILGHSFFDFDLQFVSVFLLLIFTMDFELCRISDFKVRRAAVKTVAVLLVAVSVYFGAVNSLSLLSKYEEAYKLYPGDTEAQLYLMTSAEDTEKSVAYADSIISKNKFVALAYDVKANEAYEKGDVLTMIEYKQKALDCSLYNINEYNDFGYKLISVIALYKKMGDEKSAEYCEEKLVEVAQQLEAVRANTSALAWEINDKPQLDLAPEIAEYIEGLK